LLSCPIGLTSDDQDNLYITNFRNSLIIKLTPAGVASVFADTTEWTGSTFGPNGHIIFSNERLYVAGAGAQQVFELSLAGDLTLLAGTGDKGHADGPLLEASFLRPNGIDVSPDGRLLYTNTSESPDSSTPNVVRVIELPGISQDFHINAGHAGAWFNPATSGQGQFIDLVPADQFMFISWFTFTDAASDNPNEQQWYTAQGNYSGDTAVLDLFETLGGKFDDPQEVTTTQVGEVTLTFSDCEQGQMTYLFDNEELQGEFPL
jgi:hypothetical protein